MRPKIELTDSTQDVFVKMSEGNPGALTVLMDMFNGDPNNVLLVLSLDDMNIRGPQIWVGYKDYCGAMREGDEKPPSKEEILARFMKAIEDRDPEMVKAINDECIYDNQFGSFKEVAVTSGASFKRPE